MVADERAEAAPRRTEILGRIDIADAGRVSGWAWDQARPEHRLQVQIWHRDRLLGTTMADRERADLKRNGIGDGCHAFQFKLDPSAEKLDVSTLVAKVVGPDLIDPVPLFRPSETQVVVERTVLLPFARLQKTLDVIAERQLKLARACDSLRDEKQNAPSEIKAFLDRILAGQERLEERLKEVEVFQARFDSALRALSERSAAGTNSAEAPLKRAMRLLAGATFVSCCAVVLLLLRPILG
jgi:hypothetical protein